MCYNPLGYYFQTVNIRICIKDVNVTYTKKTEENIYTKNSNVLYLNMEFISLCGQLIFNVPVSLVLCNHENIKVLSQLLVIFILYIEYPSSFSVCIHISSLYYQRSQISVRWQFMPIVILCKVCKFMYLRTEATMTVDI